MKVPLNKKNENKRWASFKPYLQWFSNNGYYDIIWVFLI